MVATLLIKIHRQDSAMTSLGQHHHVISQPNLFATKRTAAERLTV